MSASKASHLYPHSLELVAVRSITRSSISGQTLCYANITDWVANLDLTWLKQQRRKLPARFWVPAFIIRLVWFTRDLLGILSLVIAFGKVRLTRNHVEQGRGPASSFSQVVFPRGYEIFKFMPHLCSRGFLHQGDGVLVEYSTIYTMLNWEK